MVSCWSHRAHSLVEVKFCVWQHASFPVNSGFTRASRVTGCKEPESARLSSPALFTQLTSWIKFKSGHLKATAGAAWVALYPIMLSTWSKTVPQYYGQQREKSSIQQKVLGNILSLSLISHSWLHFNPLVVFPSLCHVFWAPLSESQREALRWLCWAETAISLALFHATLLTFDSKKSKTSNLKFLLANWFILKACRGKEALLCNIASRLRILKNIPFVRQRREI